MILNEAFCINLDSRQDRWKSVCREAKSFPPSFKLHRFNAISNPKEPRTGCAESHIALARMAKNMGMEYVLVLEDDVYFTEAPYEAFHLSLSNVPSDWDILLGGYYETPLGDRVSDNIYKVYYAQCTHCIIYRETSYEWLMRYSNVPIGIDDYISYLAATKKINLYRIHPSIAKQKKGFSDIKNTVFDWNDENHYLKRDYSTYKNFFSSMYNNDIESMSGYVRQIKDGYLRNQSQIMLNKFIHEYSL